MAKAPRSSAQDRDSKRSWKRWLWVLALAALVFIGGMSRNVAYAWWAAQRDTADFLPSEIDPRVFYERGAEGAAHSVASALPAALRVVQTALEGEFHIPVRIYVCAQIETFTRYGANARAGGLTVNHRIFISPKPENSVERVPSLLAHELSHLLLGQDLGLLGYGRLPVWFAEGLAVVVSGGAGAESVTADEARAAIAAGHSFVPDAGGLFERRGAHAAGLSQHMFYRQAALFVAYLRSSAPARFGALIAALQQGTAFDTAFVAAYGVLVGAQWDQFVSASGP